MKVRKPEENHWVVGLNASKLFCVVCKSPDTFPQVGLVGLLISASILLFVTKRINKIYCSIYFLFRSSPNQFSI